MELWKEFAQFGMAGIILAVLFVLLRWVMGVHDRMMSETANERKLWHTMIGTLSEKIGAVNDSIAAHSLSAQIFHQQVTEAHKFQREEHMKQLELGNAMLQKLAQICNGK